MAGFNEAVHEGGITLRPCAYLHNYRDDGIISHGNYDGSITHDAATACRKTRAAG